MSAQILLRLGEMSTQLALINQKVDGIPVADHEVRIRALERFRWTLAGLWVAGSAIGGLAGFLLGHVKA